MNGKTLGTHEAPLFPTNEEIDEIILSRDSLFWRRFSDPRLLLGAGYVLLMQVAHPTVGVAVRDHSDFAERPWERLLRTVDYLVLITYSGHEAANVGRRVYDLHRSIKGQNPDGSRYHALDPEAYAWVHATLVEGGIRAYKQFVGSLSAGEADRLIAEGVSLGRLAGVGPNDLPTTRKDFHAYFHSMVENRLDNNETVQRVLQTIEKPGPPACAVHGTAGRPPLPIVERIWPLARILPAQAFLVATIGLLPETLRRRFGVTWSAARETELKIMAAPSRALTPLLPKKLIMRLPDVYLRVRREAIAQGPLGSNELDRLKI